MLSLMCDEVTICLFLAGKQSDKVSFGKSSMVGGFKEPEQITGRDEVADYTTGHRGGGGDKLTSFWGR